MLSVPRALTSKSVLGSSREVVTATCPARWRTASWLRTCSGSAAAFLTSSLMEGVRWGYRVSSHFRLRSVPGRLRLSSSVANQPSLIRWIAALTPRKPAPPVIRIRRSGSAGIGGRDLVLVRRSDGSIAALTLAGGYASEEGDAHDPGRAREHQRFASGVSGARVQVGAGQKQRGENPVDHVQQPLRGVAAQQQRGKPEQPLHRRDARHDQVGRPKSAADPLVAEVVVRAPESEQQPEHEQDAGAVAVQEAECFDQSRTQAGDLLAEIIDGEAKSLFELDPRLPPQVVMRPPVVQRDPVHVALARRPEERLELVLGQDRQLAKQVVDRDRDAGADVIRASVAFVQGREVRCRDVPDMQHVARLVSIAVDRHRLAFDHPAGKDCDHAAFLGEEVLARAVDVGVAKRRESEAEGALERAEVLLERKLGRAVRRKRPDRVVLAGGDDVGLAVESAACGAEDDLAHRVVNAGVSPSFVQRVLVPAANVLEIAARLPEGVWTVAVRITGDDEMKRLNRTYAGGAHATDVLSFTGTGSHVGDIAISWPAVTRRAAEHGHDEKAELALLAVHGLLHLLGWDHAKAAERREMNRLTVAALERSGIKLAPNRL